MAENEEELKSLLIKVKQESEKFGLKFNIQKIKIMASGTITSWQVGKEKVEAVIDFIFLGSKVTADSDYIPKKSPLYSKPPDKSQSLRESGMRAAMLRNFNSNTLKKKNLIKMAAPRNT